MTVEPASDRTAELLALVDAVVYADLFDASATIDELHRFARTAIDRQALECVLASDPVLGEVVVRTPSDTFTLQGRSHLALDDVDRSARSRELRRRAIRVGRVLRHVPFVRGVALTGSVAAGDAAPGADVDLLVIVDGDRIATVFALLGTSSRLLGRRMLCPNYYAAEGFLDAEVENVYVGHEIGQAQPIVGNAAALRCANPWVDEMFPNLPNVARAPLQHGGRVQRLLEASLSGRAGQAVERRARRLARTRLRAHYKGDVPRDVVSSLEAGETLRFHASGLESSVPRRYEALRTTVSEMLQRAEQRRRPGDGPLPQAGRSS